MTNTWFTSDLHFGHTKVAEHRGFADSDDHDNYLRWMWNRTVMPFDTVWVLGDLSSGSKSKEDRALDILSELPGTLHLISGNHDSIHPMHSKAYKRQAAFNEVFASVSPFARKKVNGQEYLLSHFPYKRDRGAARHTQYRLPDEGLPLLHGHVHTADQRVGRELHVGLDAWGLQLMPISIVSTFLSNLKEEGAV